MHDSAFKDAKNFVEKYLSPTDKLKIADIGSMDVNGSLKSLFLQNNWSYVGCDLSKGKNVDLVLDSLYLWNGIKSNTFDVVVSTQVLEHVQHPWRWIKEIERIVKPNGLVYICTPNTIGFHEYPIDCWRVWPDGMKGLFEETCLKPIEVYAKIPDTTGIARKMNYV